MWQDEGGSEYYGGNDFAIYKYINSTHCPLETHSNVIGQLHLSIAGENTGLSDPCGSHLFGKCVNFITDKELTYPIMKQETAVPKKA